MRTCHVLAFDMGASSYRCLYGGYDGERLSLRELARFENTPLRHGERVAWDF